MKELFAKENFLITDTQCDKFVAYRKLLLEYNQKFNLTAITDETEIVVKHFIDSVYGAQYLPESGTVIDVGSGAGFPAIPLNIFTDGRNCFVLLDSLNKRVNFLNTVIEELDLHNISAIHSRAEEEAAVHREFYDCVIARAVAALPTLLEYSLPLLKKGGTLIAYKGDAEEEINASKNALKELGGEISEVKEYLLDSEYKRSLIIVKKVKDTPKKYPRGQNKPRISPL